MLELRSFHAGPELDRLIQRFVFHDPTDPPAYSSHPHASSWLAKQFAIEVMPLYKENQSDPSSFLAYTHTEQDFDMLVVAGSSS